MRPVVIHTAAAYPQAQTIIFREFGQCFTFLLMVDIVIIAISEFEEADIAIFAFRIMFDTFQASEQQRLAHAIQICAQRIHQHHTVRNRVSGKIVIVGRACQRVIQDLVETATAKLFGNQVLQFITAVSRSLIAQIRLYIVTEFHIIISVNTENILDHVDIALYINTIYRHINHQTFGSFGNDLHFQAFQNALDRFNRNHLADQCIDLIVSQFHTIGGNRNRINILDSTRNRWDTLFPLGFNPCFISLYHITYKGKHKPFHRGGQGLLNGRILQSSATDCTVHRSRLYGPLQWTIQSTAGDCNNSTDRQA